MKITIGHKWPLAPYEIREMAFEFDPEVDAELYLPGVTGSVLEKEVALRNFVAKLIRAEMLMSGAKINQVDMQQILDKENKISNQLLVK